MITLRRLPPGKEDDDYMYTEAARINRGTGPGRDIKARMDDVAGLCRRKNILKQLRHDSDNQRRTLRQAKLTEAPLEIRFIEI